MIKVFYRTCGETHHEQHAAAYELLYAAAEFCGYDVSLLKVEKTEYGKPFFVGRNDVFFSISHTSGLVVCAIGDSPCGIDAERIREIPKRVRDRYLGGAEGIEALYRWTELESFGKLDGRGVLAGSPGESIAFSRFSLDGFAVTVAYYGENKTDILKELPHSEKNF